MDLFTVISKDFDCYLRDRRKLAAFLTVLFFSRGFHLLLSYRLQQFLLQLSLPGLLFAKILAYVTSCLTGCDISYHAKIASGVYFPHVNGIVIGDGVSIEPDVVIHHQVTIGNKSKDETVAPYISSGAVLGAGCKILGAITIGQNAYIGANAVVLRDIPADTTAVGVPAHVV